MIQLGVILALIAAFSFSISNIFAKKLTLKTSSYNSVFFTSFFISLFSFIFFLFEDKNYFFNLEIIIIILIGGLCSFFGNYYLFKSLKKLDLGRTLIIANSYPFLILLLSVIILKEEFNILVLVPMILIFSGIIFLFEIKNMKASFNLIKLPLIVSINWGVFYFMITYLSKQGFSAFTIVFFLQLVLFISSFLYGFKFKKIEKPENLKEVLLYSSISGFLVMSGIALITLSQILISPAISSSIKSFEIILSTILAFFIYKEKICFKKGFGIFLGFLGILIFNFL